MVIIIERLAVRSCGPVVDEVSVMLEVVVRNIEFFTSNGTASNRRMVRFVVNLRMEMKEVSVRKAG